MITIFLIVFILPFLFAFVIGMVEGLTGMDIIPDTDEVINEEIKESYNSNWSDEPTFVLSEGKFQEKISNGVYSVRITEIKEIDRYPFKPTDGYMYIAVHFILTNNYHDVHFILTNNYHDDVQMWEEHVDCITDGLVQNRSWDSTLKNISSDYISPGLSIDGWEIYEVPKNIQTIKIKYGDFVIINIDPNEIQLLNQN